MKTITIIGAGWLGKPLALHLSQNYTVHASRRSDSAVAEFKGTEVNGFIIDLDENNIDIKDLLSIQKPHIVIGAFPPGFRRGLTDQYRKNWQKLVDASSACDVEKIIMISTTGVYPDVAKEMLEEDASLELALNNSEYSEKARRLLEAESEVISSSCNFVVVRCGGLFGPARNPARFAAKLKSVSTKAPANMVHLEDVIGIIEFAIVRLDNTIINAVCPETPSKAEFYQAALDSITSQAPLPPISNDGDKRVSSSYLQKQGYSFIYTNPITALNNC